MLVKNCYGATLRFRSAAQPWPVKIRSAAGAKTEDDVVRELTAVVAAGRYRLSGPMGAAVFDGRLVAGVDFDGPLTPEEASRRTPILIVGER
jgi:hypothetical protein